MSDGNIVRTIDILAEKDYTYTYEEGKLVRSAESRITLDNEMVVAKTLLCSVIYSYDNEDNLTSKRIIFADGSEQTIYYENSEDGNPVVKLSVNGKTVTSHSKNDSFGRKEFDELQIGSGFVSRKFAYHAGEITQEHKNAEKVKSSPTTQLVSQIVLSDESTLSYSYDNEERITQVIHTLANGNTTTTEYEYDALGQLIKETVNDVVINEMTYNNYGNILTKNGKTYTYDNTWKDLLVGFGNQTISYDAQGNPTNYCGNNLTWEKGRQLKSYEVENGNRIDYTYNANGIRTSKTVNGVKHEYVLDGANILKETWENNTLIPMYDNEESVCGIIYNGTPYYFLKNLQGDVIAIVDSNAEVVSRYYYDAWGDVANIIDETEIGIGFINPYRYRGYYYDEDTMLYYLQSRYYDPLTGRFINGDEVMFLGVDGSVASYNLFAYCGNDVIIFADPSGYIKLEIRVQVPKVNSTVVWAFKNGSFTAGHTYVVLDPEGDKNINKGLLIARGFEPNTTRTAWVAVGRTSVKGRIKNPKTLRYDSKVSYSITKEQYDKVYSFLYGSPKKYNVISYNCTTFAIDALNKAGIKHKFKKHLWNIGTTAYIISLVGLLSSVPLLMWPASFLLSFSFSYGYTPARLAYDINKGVR